MTKTWVGRPLPHILMTLGAFLLGLMLVATPARAVPNGTSWEEVEFGWSEVFASGSDFYSIFYTALAVGLSNGENVRVDYEGSDPEVTLTGSHTTTSVTRSMVVLLYSEEPVTLYADGQRHMVFDIADGKTLTVYLYNVTLDGKENGGGIENTGDGTLVVADAVIQNCRALNGGGVQSQGPTEIRNSRFTGNEANINGGGVWSAGPAVVRDSHFEGNATQWGDGGGVTMRDGSGSLTVTDSVFVENRAPSGHGGGAHARGSLVLTGSRFTGNSANIGGGAAWADGSLTIDPGADGTVIRGLDAGKNLLHSGGGWGIQITGEGSLTLGTGKIGNFIFASQVIDLTLEDLSILRDTDGMGLALGGVGENSVRVLGDCAIETTGDAGSHGIVVSSGSLALEIAEAASLKVTTNGTYNNGIDTQKRMYMDMGDGGSLRVVAQGADSYGIYGQQGIDLKAAGTATVDVTSFSAPELNLVGEGEDAAIQGSVVFDYFTANKALGLTDIAIYSTDALSPAIDLRGTGITTMTVAGDCAIEARGNGSSGILSAGPLDLTVEEGAGLDIATFGDYISAPVNCYSDCITVSGGYWLYLTAERGARLGLEAEGYLTMGIQGLGSLKVTLKEDAGFFLEQASSTTPGIMAGSFEVTLDRGTVLVVESGHTGINDAGVITLRGTPAFLYVAGEVYAFAGAGLSLDGLEGSRYPENFNMTDKVLAVVGAPGLQASALNEGPITTETTQVLLDVSWLLTLEDVAFGLEYSPAGQDSWTAVPGVTVSKDTRTVEVSQVLDAPGSYEFRLGQTVSYQGAEYAGLSDVLRLDVAGVPNITITVPTYDDVTVGYERPGAGDIIVKNTGTANATITRYDFNYHGTSWSMSNFNMSAPKTLAPGETLRVLSLQPPADLPAGTYVVDITVIYDNGRTATAQVSIRVQPAQPGEPEALKATVSSRQVVLAWAPPKHDGGSGILRYEVCVNGGAWTDAGHVLTYTLSDLTNGVAYDFQVRAVNAVGAGAAASVSATPQASNSGSSGSSSSSSYVVTFQSNGGSEVARQRVSSGGNAKEPVAPTREGFHFMGWYTDEKGTEKYDFSTKVTKSITLYALWSSAENPGPEGIYDHPAYISGYEDGTFRPDNTLSRGEAATLLYNLMEGGSSALSYVPDFSDVTGEDWYYDAVMELGRRGAIQGYEDGSYRPDETVTRGEFLAMAIRFWGIPQNVGEMNFTDMAEDHWAGAQIATAVREGYVTGYPDGTFRPNGTVSRGEAVTILNRILGCDGLSAGAEFSDVPVSHWAYEAIMGAATGHDH